MDKEYMSDELKTLIVNFRVLGSLQQGDKIRARSEKYIKKDPNIWYTPFLRMKNGEDRLFTSTIVEKQVRSLRDIVNSAYFDQFLQTKEGRPVLDELIEILSKAVTGLKTLQDTYMDDDTFVSLISVEISMLNQINNKLIEKQPPVKEVLQKVEKEVKKDNYEKTNLLLNEVEDYLKNNENSF